MDIRVVNSVVKVTSEIFNTMVFLILKPGEAREIVKTSECFDFTGIIGLSGACPGAVGVRFPKALAAKVATKMLGAAVNENSTEIRDTVGELTNMVAGGLKNELDKVGIHFDISIPTVIAGDQHTFTVMGDTPGIVVPFDVEGANFMVEVCFKKK